MSYFMVIALFFYIKTTFLYSSYVITFVTLTVKLEYLFGKSLVLDRKMDVKKHIIGYYFILYVIVC